MKDTCWKLFSYLILDHKAAQAELNAMAAKGWELETLWNELPLAKFRRTDRADLRYFVDWADTAKPEANEYVQLCKDAGWELVHTMSYCHIYASTPGCDPLPIQTDPQLEYQRFRKKVVRRIALTSTLPFIPYLLLWLWMYFESRKYHFLALSASEVLTDSFLGSNALSTLLLSLPLLFPLILVYLFCLVGQLRAWSRAVREGALPEPNVPAAKRRGLLTLFSRVYALILALLLLVDTTLNGLLNWGFPVGMLIGTAIRWCMYDDPKFRKQTRKLFAVSALVLVCFLSHSVVRDLVPSRLPLGQVLPQAVSIGADSRTDTFLGSKVYWSEYCLRDRGWTNSVRFQAKTWVFPALAQRFPDGPEEGMLPLEGYENVWYSPRNDEEDGTYFLRRGVTELTVTYREADGQAALEHAIRWLETYG